jgi:hypothetical protein
MTGMLILFALLLGGTALAAMVKTIKGTSKPVRRHSVRR